MENKKKVFAIVLFLLLGLITFTFANPSENEKLDDNGNGKTTEKSSSKDKNTTKDNTTTTDNNATNDNTNGTNNDGTNTVANTGNNAVVNNNNNGNNANGNNTTGGNNNNGTNDNNTPNDNNNTNPADDNNNNDEQAKIEEANKKAEEAVEKAEETYNEDDVKDAEDLVSNLTDEDKKEELEERLDDVKDAIAVIALVDELEEKTTSATNKEELDAARNFREESEVEDKVDALKDEELKEELNERLEEFAKILDDTTPATIEGIEDGAVTNEDVTLTATDENEVTATLYKDGEKVEYNLGETITEEGNYKLVVTDAAFNTSEITFTVDKTAPKVNFGNGKITDEAFTIEVTDDNFDYMTIWNNKTGETVKITENTYTLPDEAEDNVRYKVTAYDKAGNVTPVSGKDQSIYHDNVKPVITLNGEETVNTVYNSVRLNVSDGSLKKVVITKGEDTKEETFDNNYTIKKVTYEVELTEEGTHTVKATDRQGNETEVTFTIDATAPTLTVKDGEEFTKGQNGTYSLVSFKLYDANKVKEVEINGKVFTLTESNWSDVNYIKPGSWNAVEGENTITLRDAAGNETTQTFVLDTTAPTYVNLGILNKDNYPNKGSLEYAKTGSNIRVLVSFKEKLAVEPTVTINGKEFKATFRPQSSSETTFFYMVDHKITEEDNFAEGELQIKVYGYADEAGNVGEELTNSNITYKKYAKVIYDKTAPKVNFGNGNITDQAFTIEVTDDNFDYMTIWTNKTGKTVTVEGNTYTLPEEAEDNVRYKVTAYDKAGNFTPVEGKDQSIYHDNVKPVVTINGEDVKEESYTSAKVNVSDGSLKKVVITKGEETLKDESFANNYTINKITYETEITEDGVYTVTATDRKGNETTVTFTVETEETKAIKAAEAAVEQAEQTKDQADVDAAEALVEKLPEGEKKDELEKRLEKVQDEIDAAARAKALEEATAAVEKAERTFKEEDYNTAKTLVDALDDSEAKTALENRLKDVKDAIEAEKAVVVAETERTQEAVDAARKLVNALKDSDKKTELTNRLDAIQTELNEKAAEAAVENAEETKDQDDVNTARDLVNELPDGDKKDELEDRLDKVQEEINAEAKAKALAEATAAVEKAERTFKEEDYNTAKALVDALEDSDAKTALENRLKDVKDVIEAEKAVVVAETERTQATVDAARELVNALKDSDKKTELKNRLDAIQTELNQAAEEAEAQKALQDAIDALKAKISEARTYLTNGNVYTDDSKAALERAIANAQSIVDTYGRGETVTLEQISNASDAIDEAIDGLVVKEGTIEKNDVKILFKRTQWLTTNYNITVEGDVKNVKLAEGYYTSDSDYPQDATVVATSAGTFAHHGRWLKVYTVRVEKNDGEVVFARYYALAIF